MDPLFGALLRGIGSILAFLYDLVGNYGVAIILLTLVIRVALLPLTIKQTRSMSEMQRIQPLIKEIQKKYKGNRQKLNEELMKVYKEHKVNPLGGCLPLLMQAPVFLALFAVLRAAHPAVAMPEDLRAQAIPDTAVCAPAQAPSVSGDGSNEIFCSNGTNERFIVEEWRNAKTGREIEAPPEMFRCTPAEGDPDGLFERDHFTCQTPLGSGHLPEDSRLYREIVEDAPQFLGMELSCSPTQAGSRTGVRQCSRSGRAAGGVPLIGYWGLVGLMVGTTWYQQRQMQQMSGQSNPQMQMMGRIMPVFLGFISLSIPTGVLVYWVTTNFWQVGQQRVMMRRRDNDAPPPDGKRDRGDERPSLPKGGKPSAPPAQPRRPTPSGGGSGRSGGGSRKKRRKR